MPLAQSLPLTLCSTGAALWALVACSDLGEPPIGQLHLGLSSGLGESQFRLRKASFAIAGTAELTLSSEDDPDSDTIERALPAGDYEVELLPGWQLEQLGPLGAAAVAADLASENPLAFSIAPGALTTLTFQFRTSGGPVNSGGDGQVRIEIAVDGVGNPGVVISEYMKNPELLPDAEGEWFELYNAGSVAVDLGGCSVSRDDQALTLEGGFPIAPGGFLTFANGQTPGFTPDIMYSGLTLPNSGAFRLRLACGEQLIDEVTFDATKMTNRAGRSLSLSALALDDRANDLATNWCEGVSAYNGDLGTPGTANPACAP